MVTKLNSEKKNRIEFDRLIDLLELNSRPVCWHACTAHTHTAFNHNQFDAMITADRTYHNHCLFKIDAKQISKRCQIRIYRIPLDNFASK